MSSRLRRFIERRFPDNAFDRPADREVILNRIEGALKFRGVLDQFVGSMLLGGIAGVGGILLVHYKPGGSLAATAEWFFRNATELNIWFVLLTLGVASALVASHTELKRQGWLRRLLFLPFVRMTGDAMLLAFAAFASASIACLASGPAVLGEGDSAVALNAFGLAKDATFFMLVAAFTTFCRLIVDSILDDALFRLVNRRDPGLRRTLAMMGYGGFGAFAVALFALTLLG